MSAGVAAAGIGAAGNLLSAGLNFYGAHEQQIAAKDAATQSEMGKLWTQLLGLKQLRDFEGTQNNLLGKYMQAITGSAQTMGKLPSAARAGEKRALGQVSGAEAGAIAQVLANQQAQQGAVKSGSASKGFYGSSVMGANSAMAREQMNRSISDIMGQVAGTKAGIVGQGTQNLMQGLLAKAQGQQLIGIGNMAVHDKKYSMARNRLQTILNTGNVYGVNHNSLNVMLDQLKPYQGQFTQGESNTWQHWSPQAKGQGGWMKDLF